MVHLRTYGALSQPEDLPGETTHEVDRRFQGLVLVETVFSDEIGEVPAVESARHVVPDRDGAERAGVVDET